MLWTTDEEVGSGTSRAVIETEARASDAVLVMEPSLTRRRLQDTAERLRRVHADASTACRRMPGIDPRQGASAIHELARLILAVEKLSDPDRGVSVNAGVISGGTRPNVVAEAARGRRSTSVPRRWRMPSASSEQFRNLHPSIPGDTRDQGRIRTAAAGTYGWRSASLSTGAGRGRTLGRDLAEGATGGGSDGNFTAALGVATLDGLGPQGDGAHALHEHVLLVDLPWRAAFLAGLLQRINTSESKIETWQTVSRRSLLLGALSGILLVIGELAGGSQGLMFAFAFAVVMNIGSYWFSDKIVLRMYQAKQVGAEHPLYQSVARLAQRGGLPMPKVYIIPDSVSERLRDRA